MKLIYHFVSVISKAADSQELLGDVFLSILRALTIVYFLICHVQNYIFLPEVANKTIACYTFSVRPTDPKSKNRNKKIDEEENEDFCLEEYYNFKTLILGENLMFYETISMSLGRI